MSSNFDGYIKIYEFYSIVFNDNIGWINVTMNDSLTSRKLKKGNLLLKL